MARSKSIVDMTRGPLARQMLFFSIPLMLCNLLQVLFNMADVAVVGQFAGPSALGSVGSTTMLINLFTCFLIGVGNGVNVTVARAIGAQKPQEVRRSVHTGFLLLLIMGAVILLITQCGGRLFLEILNTKAELIDGAERYFRIYMLSMPAVALYNWGSATLSAAGDTRRPLLIMAAAGVVNLCLNLFFVICLHLDVVGVALASAIAEYLAVGMILFFLVRSGESIAFRPDALRIHGDKARAILALGVPSGMQSIIFALANLLVQASVNSFDAVMVEGNAAAANVDPIFYNAMLAVYVAGSSFIGQNYGAGDIRRIRRSYLIMLAYSFGIGVLLGIPTVVFGRYFLAIFTTDPAVIEAGMERLLVMGPSFAFSCFMDGSIAASRGLGKTLVPTVMVILGACVFRVIWVFTVFAYFHTVTSLFSLYIFSWSITGAAEVLYFIHTYKKAKAEFAA